MLWTVLKAIGRAILWVFYHKETGPRAPAFNSQNYPRGTMIICSFRGSPLCRSWLASRTEVLAWSDDSRYFLVVTRNNDTGRNDFTWLESKLFYNVSKSQQGISAAKIAEYRISPENDMPPQPPVPRATANPTPTTVEPENIPPHLQ